MRVWLSAVRFSDVFLVFHVSCPISCEFIAAGLDEGFFLGGHVVFCQQGVAAIDEEVAREGGVEHFVLIGSAGGALQKALELGEVAGKFSETLCLFS